MALFLLKRLGMLALTMLVVSVAVFLLLELTPGTVATKVLGQYATAEQRR